jgi:membrane-associated phospholipid phosphatase
MVLALIRHAHADRFAAAAGRLGAAYDLTLLSYWAFPTAPPWWSSEKTGRMEGEVHRVITEVLRWLKREPHPTRGDNESQGANSFASMPSDHFGTAAMAAILLGEVDARLGVAGWVYALTLGFGLVYLGEHYVTDLLAGLALTLAVNRACLPLERLARAVLRPDD